MDTLQTLGGDALASVGRSAEDELARLVAWLHSRGQHPDWEYDTTEGPRKAWDLAAEPPDGAGWERNVDMGRNGWERLEYTEESYWRRLRPGPSRKRRSQYRARRRRRQERARVKLGFEAPQSKFSEASNETGF